MPARAVCCDGDHDADLDVALYVSFSQYFPTESEFDFSLERVPAGVSVNFQTSFSDPDTSTPLECSPFVTTVPVPLDG